MTPLISASFPAKQRTASVSLELEAASSDKGLKEQSFQYSDVKALAFVRLRLSIYKVNSSRILQSI